MKANTTAGVLGTQQQQAGKERRSWQQASGTCYHIAGKLQMIHVWWQHMCKPMCVWAQLDQYCKDDEWTEPGLMSSMLSMMCHVEDRDLRAIRLEPIVGWSLIGNPQWFVAGPRPLAFSRSSVAATANAGMEGMRLSGTGKL
jgi:hypothetical protein